MNKVDIANSTAKETDEVKTNSKKDEGWSNPIEFLMTCIGLF